MSTYLLTWNSKRWRWENLRKCIDDIQQNGYYAYSWSSGNNKKILPNDRLFMIHLGNEPRGIFASGWATSGVYKGKHWDKQSQVGKQFTLYVDINFDVLLDLDNEVILPLAKLKEGIFANMRWDSQASGVRIPNEIAIQLEIEWSKLTGKLPVAHNAEVLPEEIDHDRKYFEGAIKQITVNIYERNAEARTRCIRHYGASCYICGFNFERVFGKIGMGFIHVHHLKPLFELNAEYELNPIEDLRPVCPNCHAMIHRQKSAYSIEEIKEFLKSRSAE